VPGVISDSTAAHRFLFAGHWFLFGAQIFLFPGRIWSAREHSGVIGDRIFRARGHFRIERGT
jgi:hypothetical protein